MAPTNSKNWTADPRAIALLTSCGANPPAGEFRRHAYVLTTDEWFEYTGRRADQLRAIWREHGQRLLDQAHATGADADYAALNRHFEAPTVEDAINAAVAAAADVRVAA